MFIHCHSGSYSNKCCYERTAFFDFNRVASLPRGAISKLANDNKTFLVVAESSSKILVASIPWRPVKPCWPLVCLKFVKKVSWIWHWGIDLPCFRWYTWQWQSRFSVRYILTERSLFILEVSRSIIWRLTNYVGTGSALFLHQTI